MSDSFTATRPSNIALIKYMGKRDTEKNVPTNPSLSFTLNHLVTTVTLKYNPLLAEDQWAENTLTNQEKSRFVAHLSTIRDYFDFQGYFTIDSYNHCNEANTPTKAFPSACGLASSASSFAALTDCATHAICTIKQYDLPPVETIAALSQLGSGSSCRSFFSPWALWENTSVQGLNLPYQHLDHNVIVVSNTKKAVSSSSAHQRVTSSPLFNGRIERAKKRCEKLIDAFNSKQWSDAFELCWEEFNDMHSLFETATPPFHYMTDKTKAVLSLLKSHWDQHGDGPIVTLDAGPNIHCLYRPDQRTMQELINTQLNTLPDIIDIL